MENTFKIRVSDKELTILPQEEVFSVIADHPLAVIRRSFDEFDRWEQVWGNLSQQELREIGEGIERYYQV